MKFSERIRILRKERGITQKETAAGLGIGYRAYQCYELNQRYPVLHGRAILWCYYNCTTVQSQEERGNFVLFF